MSHNSGIARAAEIFARIEEKAERREKLTVEEAGTLMEMILDNLIERDNSGDPEKMVSEALKWCFALRDGFLKYLPEEKNHSDHGEYRCKVMNVSYEIPKGAVLKRDRNSPDLYIPPGNHTVQQIVNFLNTQERGGREFFATTDGRIGCREIIQLTTSLTFLP
ncbi:MAG: hypothetical protein CMF59_16655 [Leptospiraceae bacterium]|nr:hypothetical protein [Leptospiraceae bacterium]